MHEGCWSCQCLGFRRAWPQFLLPSARQGPGIGQCRQPARPSAVPSPALQGVTLTLWSTCGLSRGGLYGEWQGVICTGENSSQVQVWVPAWAPRVAGAPGLGWR